MAESIAETRTDGRAGISAAVLDRLEQVVIVVMFCLLTYRVIGSVNPLAALLLVSESVVVVFTLFRRSTSTISVRLGDWLLATTATAAPMLVSPIPHSPAALVIPGVLLVVLGNCFQVSSKLILRRSFGIAPANRGVKVSGPYRVVRHPMYAGYMVANIGLLLLMPSVLNLMVYAIGWSAQVLRILAEERLLSQDEAYRALQAKTRYRLIPGVF